MKDLIGVLVFNTMACCMVVLAVHSGATIDAAWEVLLAGACLTAASIIMHVPAPSSRERAGRAERAARNAAIRDRLLAQGEIVRRVSK